MVSSPRGKGQPGPQQGPPKHGPLTPLARGQGRQREGTAVAQRTANQRNTPIALGFCLFFNKQNFLLVWFKETGKLKRASLTFLKCFGYRKDHHASSSLNFGTEWWSRLRQLSLSFSVCFVNYTLLQTHTRCAWAAKDPNTLSRIWLPHKGWTGPFLHDVKTVSRLRTPF